MKVNWRILIALVGCIVIAGGAVNWLLGGYYPVIALLVGGCIGLLFSAFRLNVIE